MDPNEKNKYPRILVISNNPFSENTNNGKTLASFFDKYPADKIAQLYFNSEIPNNFYCKKFFRITDRDILKSFVRKDGSCGTQISSYTNTEDNERRIKSEKIIDNIKNFNIPRIAREIFWKREAWKTNSLEQWLDGFSPQVIFFCAGDSGFAYDITQYIQDKFNTKLVVYITDDYVLPRRTLSPFWWIRRNVIYKKMKHAVTKSDLFITISKQMRDVYKGLFGKDSILAVNMTESMKKELIPPIDSRNIVLVYAGGLHYKRYKTLHFLAKSLKEYNENQNNKQRAYLKVYSGQTMSSKVLKYLNVEGASEYCGKLNSEELKEVLNACDIPVHVESFDFSSIESTRLSVSTKISEYLSLGKPILAIGPDKVASMKYLKDCAYCVTDANNIYSEIKTLFKNNDLRDQLSQKALLKYETNHKKDMVSQNLILNILAIHEGKPNV